MSRAIKSRGARSGSRKKLRKRVRERGRPTVTAFLRDFKVGEKVVIKINPSVHVGMPHPRFEGKGGVVERKQGDCFVASVFDGGKEKKLIVSPVHLKKL